MDIKKDWSVQYKNLQLTQLAIMKNPDIIQQLLDPLMAQIHKLLLCLRSTVFKEAIVTLSVLYAQFTGSHSTVLSPFLEMSTYQVILKAGSAS